MAADARPLTCVPDKAVSCRLLSVQLVEVPQPQAFALDLSSSFFPAGVPELHALLG